MIVRASDLYNREVICVKDGSRLGTIGDVVIDNADGKVVSVIIYGKPRLFGLLGREEDVVIPWKDIEVLGDDTVLVTCEPPHTFRRREKRFLSNFFD